VLGLDLMPGGGYPPRDFTNPKSQSDMQARHTHNRQDNPRVACKNRGLCRQTNMNHA
jgi:hypothetical protein